MSKRVDEMGAQVPLWIVASLGKKVALVEPFDDGLRTYPAGSLGVLVAIRGDDMPRLSVDVCLNPDDPTDWERFTPSQLRPPSQQISFALDIEEGFIAF